MPSLVIGGDLKICDISGGNGYMNNHTHSQQDWDSNNGDVSSRNGFINIHTLSQYNYFGIFKEICGEVQISDTTLRFFKPQKFRKLTPRLRQICGCELCIIPKDIQIRLIIIRTKLVA